MQVLQDQTVVTLDKRTGDVRYIYQHGKDTPPAQYAIDVKAGSSYGQVVPPERRTH